MSLSFPHLVFLSSQDEDEDIFQSDDDLEDDAPLFFIQQQPIPMYASAGEINDEVRMYVSVVLHVI